MGCRRRDGVQSGEPAAGCRDFCVRNGGGVSHFHRLGAGDWHGVELYPEPAGQSDAVVRRGAAGVDRHRGRRVCLQQLSGCEKSGGGRGGECGSARQKKSGKCAGSEPRHRAQHRQRCVDGYFLPDGGSCQGRRNWSCAVRNRCVVQRRNPVFVTALPAFFHELPGGRRARRAERLLQGNRQAASARAAGRNRVDGGWAVQFHGGELTGIGAGGSRHQLCLGAGRDAGERAVGIAGVARIQGRQ